MLAAAPTYALPIVGPSSLPREVPFDEGTINVGKRGLGEQGRDGEDLSDQAVPRMHLQLRGPYIGPGAVAGPGPGAGPGWSELDGFT